MATMSPLFGVIRRCYRFGMTPSKLVFWLLVAPLATGCTVDATGGNDGDDVDAAASSPDASGGGDVDGMSGTSPDAMPGGGPDGMPSALSLTRVLEVRGEGLNLRDQPTTDGSTVLTVIPDGTVIGIVSGPDGDWYQVDYNGMVGWAHGGFLYDVPEADDGGYLNLLPWTAGDSWRVSQGHNGDFSHNGFSAWAWDIAMPEGTVVRAAHNGVVRRADGSSTTGCCDPSCGGQANFVTIDRGDGIESVYLHLSATSVSEGDVVVRGQKIGLSGNTGYSCGAHLHVQFQYSPADDGASGFQQSLPEYFYGTGGPVDPGVGDEPTSHNTADSAVPRTSQPEDYAYDPDVNFHGTRGDWDRTLREVGLY